MKIKMNKNSFHKLISAFLIPVILSVQALSTPLALAQNGIFDNQQNDPVEKTSLIAVLVEDDLLRNNQNYEGLSGVYTDELNEQSLRDRINRFARDVQLAQPYTRSLILRVKNTDTPASIADSLETLYFKGDDAGDIKSQLGGVIIVGDVPLPVVNKNGNRFVSLFPYTDFKDKAYAYNPKSNEFERNNDVISPKVETWHGVIKPPASGEEAFEMLSKYFDKNHLYHIGNVDYAEFDETMLLADMIWEQESTDGETFARYENYSENLENLAYKRFTKFFLKELIEGQADGDLGEDNPANVDMEMFEELPDVQSRNIILSYAMKLSSVMEFFLQRTNDYVNGLGRYETYDSTVSLITAKDLHAQEYLRMVNEAIEKRVGNVVENLDAPIPLIAESILTGQITFDDDTQVPLNSVEFMTQPQYPYGGVNTLYFNGKAAPLLNSAQECTLYRGNNAEHNRVYNPDTADQSASGYAGCYGGNIENPERCIPELATKWVFDELGTWTNYNIPQGALDYGACYDFKEKNHFLNYLAQATSYRNALESASTEEEKEALTPPASKYKSYDDIILFQQASPAITITFKDILDVYGGFDGVDNDGDGIIDNVEEYSLSYKLEADDPYTTGRELLGNRKTNFIISNPPFAGIKRIDLNVTQIPPAFPFEVPSMISNKEPTYETIRNQLEAGFPNALPATNTRFVSFQDQNGKYQKITYPNTFRIESFDNFLNELVELEQYLMTIPGAPTDIEGILQEVVTGDEHLYEDIENFKIFQTTEDMLLDSITWNMLSPDQKHAYIIKAYVDREHDVYFGEKEKGYEYMYLTAEGSANEINLNLNSNAVIIEEDETWLNPEADLPEDAEIDEEDDSDGKSALEQAIMLPLWGPYLVEYLLELAKLPLGMNFADSCDMGGVDLVELIAGSIEDHDEEASDAMDVPTGTVELNEDGIPVSAETTSTLVLEFQNNSNLISTNSTDSYEVTVKALSEEGVLSIGDSYTEVQLEIIQPAVTPRAKITSPTSLKLINGSAVFTIGATENPGEFSLMAHSNNRPEKIVSNTLPITSDERNIRIRTYKMEASDPITYTEEILKDFVVYDENENVIAEINSETAQISIKNQAYEVEVFESTPEKPMRIGIIEIQSGDIIASIVINANKNLSSEIQEATYSFEDNALNLNGVYAKDINLNDEVQLEKVENIIYAKDKSGPEEKRIAKITSSGKVFLAPEHFISIKNTGSKNQPYIFVIEDSNANQLVEFYIGYMLGSIELHNETNRLDGFNDVASIFKIFAYQTFKKALANSPAYRDSDEDGLADIEELILGTDPFNPDTDGDAYLDGEEIKYGYDPLREGKNLFEDLTPEHYAYEAITKLLLRGIITRTSDYKIRPNELITREEFVKMVLGIKCINCTSFSQQTKTNIFEEYENSPFPDTNISDNYEYCVYEGKNQGIVSGYEGGQDAGFFKPKYNISRAEAVKVILEAAKIDSTQHKESGKPWYYHYVLKAQLEDIFPKQNNPILYPVTYYSEEDFKNWVDMQLSTQGNYFENWILSPVSRWEFAVMVRNIVELYDCFLADTDNDGLPDNFETYQYNTDPLNPDTSGDGVDDFTKVLRGEDPLEYQETTVDEDMPIEKEEDQDLIEDLGPLYTDDEHNDNLFPIGAHAIGNTIEREIIYQTITEDSEEIPIYISEIPADGESTLFLSAELLDANGDTIIEDSNSIIEFNADATSTTEILMEQKKVKVDKGMALTQITSTKEAGIVNISAKVEERELPAEPHQLFVEPLDPVEIKIEPESSVIKTGGLSKTPIEIKIYDENANIANNDFLEISLYVSGPGRLDKSADLQPDEEGIQMHTFEGIFSIDLYSTEESGEIFIDAVLEKEFEEMEGDELVTKTAKIEAQNSINSSENINIQITASKDFLIAGRDDELELTLRAEDWKGDLIQGFNQQFTIKSSNEKAGDFIGSPVQNFTRGEAKISFKPSTLAENVEITTTVPGLDPATHVIPIRASTPYEIKLESDVDGIDSSINKITQLKASLYDRYGNFVSYENQIPITFNITDATKKYGEIISPKTVEVENGIATVDIRGKNKSGKLNVTASSPGLISGTISLNTVAKITADDLIGDFPNLLYATLIGSPFGDTTGSDYLAGKLLFAGKTQAVTSVTTNSESGAPILNIAPTGGLEITDPNQTTLDFIPSNTTQMPNRVIAKHPETGIRFAEIFYEYEEEVPIIVRDDIYDENLREGIFIFKKTSDPAFAFKRISDSLSITYEGKEAITISSNGKIQIANNLFSVNVSETKSPFLALNVQLAETEIAEIVFALNTNSNVNIADHNFEYQAGFSYDPGVIAKLENQNPDYEVQKSFSGSSTKMPIGAKILNKTIEIPQNQKPGFSYSSLEDIHDKQGIGFDGDNKHVLFFAAGNSVGDANKVYASEIGINLGDPTIKIKNEHLAGDTGFTRDIGKPLYYGDDTIEHVVLADYNNNSLKDILLGHKGGKVRLLQHQLSADQFEDKGLLLDLATGINAMDSADFNNDGWDDLLIATEEGCVQGETALYIYLNNQGQFTRTNIDLEIEDTVSEIKIADVNNNGYPDIILSETSGIIRIFYNEYGEINPKGQILDNLGIRVDSGQDLVTEVLIHYEGMPEKDPDSLEEDFHFKTFELETGSPDKNEFLSQEEQSILESLGASKTDMKTSEDVQFIYVDVDPVFGNPSSTKRGVDINGGTVTVGDKVVYTISLHNQTANDIDDLMLNDLMPDMLDLDVDSIECINCEEPVELLQTGQSTRPYVIANISIPSGETRHITYETTVNSVPGIKLDTNIDFDANFPKDEYIDISANPEDNPSGKLIYYYSVSKNPQTEKMTYAKYISTGEKAEPAEMPYDETDSNGNGIPDEMEDLHESQISGDDSGNGLPNSWDEINGAIEDVLDGVIAELEMFSCDGQTGCFPVPSNMAFLAPGNINFMGNVVGVDPGTPVFSYGALDVYLSPTLTGMLGNSVCISELCWTYVTPLIPPEACDAINEGIESAMTKASNFVSSPLGSVLMGGDGKNTNTNSVSPRPESGGLTGNSSLGNYQVSASSSTNIQIPGFVNFVTAWIAKQYEEILDKLSDLPDLYVYYPEMKSFSGEPMPKADFRNFNDVLTYLNKLPLVEIESRTIILKIPALSQKEIEQIQTKLDRWVLNAKLEVKRFKQSLGIVEADEFQLADPNYMEKIEKTIRKVEDNIKILEDYKALPREILEWRNIQTKYIYQIICYLDTIVQYMGGYMAKQEQRIKLWIDLVEQLKAILSSWTLLNDVMIEYQKYCGGCDTERYTLIELLSKLFVIIPELPVVPLPKWPDFYFDFSKIQLGYKIIWPDIELRTEQVIMPNLPPLKLPSVPNVQFGLPDIPELPTLPKLPAFPDLPALPLPTLPDIPKPPKIPNISGSIESIGEALKKIAKIMCLLKKALLPVPSSELKTHIETLTARPLDIVLPIDLIHNFQAPSIWFPFVKKIQVSSKIDLRLDTEHVYKTANEVAKIWNSIATDLAERASDLSSDLSDTAQSATSIPQEFTEDVELDLSTYLPDNLIEEYHQAIKTIHDLAKEQEELANSIPNEYHLIAENTYVKPFIDITESLSEKQKRIADENLPSTMKDNKIASLRNDIIAYTKSQNNSNLLLKNDDSYDSLLHIAKNHPTKKIDFTVRMVASNTELPTSEPTYKSEMNSTKELLAMAQNMHREFENRLIATNTNAISTDLIDESDISSPESSEKLKGLFVYNTETGVNERILMYEGELSKEHNAIIADMDNDEDEDIIYSYGGNIYFKENYTNPKSSDYLNYIGTTPTTYDVAEFSSFSPSVNGFDITYNSGTNANFSWDANSPGSFSGYEIIHKENRQDYEKNIDTPSTIINLFEKATQRSTIGLIRNDIEITAVRGSFTVNGSPSSLYTFGDTIETGDNPDTRVVITFSDSSQIILGANSDIILPDYIPGNFTTTVRSGEVNFVSNFFTNIFLQKGGTVYNLNGDVSLTYKNEDNVSLEPDTLFYGSNRENSYAHISALNGSGTLESLPRKLITRESGPQTLQTGQLIHTMENTEYILKGQDVHRQKISTTSNKILPIPRNYASDLEINLISGRIEIIDPQAEMLPNIDIAEGMMLQYGDTLKLESGEAVITLQNGAETYLKAGDTFMLEELSDPENPSISLDMNEGNYYAEIYTYNNSGDRSNPSEIKLAAPQICSDRDAPFAEAGPSERQIVIFQELKIDASPSFDLSGEIEAYYIDTDPEEDSDNDGDPTNDVDIINDDKKDPVFKLGPFNEPDKFTYILNVRDESGNVGQQHIDIEVIVPDIIINESSQFEDEVSGEINPSAEDIPISLIRDRKGLISKIVTDTANENGNYLTNEDGEFVITDLNYEDTILLRNVDGDAVAEIDSETGRIVILDDRYYVDVLEAIPHTAPTRIVVKEKASGEILLTMLLVPDANTDVTVDTTNTTYTSETVVNFRGVHVKDTNLNDDFIINSLPASDPIFTGAAEIVDNRGDNRISIIDSNGDIFFFDKGLDLRLKPTSSLEDPIIIEMLYGGDLIAEVYIAVRSDRPVEITNRKALGLPDDPAKWETSDDITIDDIKTKPFGRDPEQEAEVEFEDVPEDHPYYENIVSLSEKNILRGYTYDGVSYFEPDALLERRDFTDIILKMLCIFPRPESFEPPALFYDMPHSEEDYYYPVIKEAVFQGFITGYKGEEDPETGQTPFKPKQTISRAEAIKIVLEALEKQKIITLEGIEEAEDDTWYIPYVEIAQDLTPVLKKESEVKETFILTPEEAADPDKHITRAEFIAVADRVLRAFDCYALDSDGDGMPDWWEQKYGLDPYDPTDANEDPDGDGLTNFEEYIYGTNPTNPDTDGGGVTDGIEVARGTDPLDPRDDFEASEQDEILGALDEGIYIIEEPCLSCPCFSAVDHTADLVFGDKFYSVIGNKDLSTIFAKSNELIFYGLNK